MNNYRTMGFIQILKYALAVIVSVFVVYAMFTMLSFIIKAVIFIVFVSLVAGYIYRRFLR